MLYVQNSKSLDKYSVYFAMKMLSIYSETCEVVLVFYVPLTIFLIASEMKMKEMSPEKPSSVKRVMYLIM